MLCALALLFAFVPSVTHAATIHVPGDYSFIQAAINAASPGDTILVYSGVYLENVVVNKTLTLTGIDTGAGLPVIDGGGFGGATRGIDIQADDCVVQGFNVTHSTYGISISDHVNLTAIDNEVNADHWATGTRGIELVNSNDSSVSGNSVYNFDFGIYASNSYHMNVTDNVVNNCMDNGISLYSVYYSNVAGNEAYDNGLLIFPPCAGIYLQAPAYVNVTGNNVHDNGRGIHLNSDIGNPDAYCNISNNVAYNNSLDGIYWDRTRNSTLTGNTAYNNSIGIHLSSPSYDNVTDNFARDNANDGVLLESESDVVPLIYNNVTGNTAFYNTGAGIHLSYPDTNRAQYGNVTSNDVYNNSIGINMSGATYYHVDRNTANNNSLYGIYLPGSSFNGLDANSASNDSIGIRLQWGTHNNATGNEVYNNSIGIHLFTSQNNNLMANMAHNNTFDGIYLNGSSTFNNMTGNSACNNTRNGIYIDAMNMNDVVGNNINGNGVGINVLNGVDNVIYLNRIAGNDINAVPGGPIGDTANKWNSTVPLPYSYNGLRMNYTGNYWGDYAGPDSNKDGIGDVPVTLDAINVDYYPMLSSTSLVASFTANVTSGVAPLTVQFNDTSTGNPGKWNWSFGDGTGYVTTQNATHIFTDSGDYQVNLTVTNSKGSSTANETISVLAFGPVKNLRTGLTYMSIQAAINNANTVNGDTILVNSSIYYENVFVNKTLTLRGNDTGSGLPVVDGQGSSAITVKDDYVTVQGFNATNATGFNQAGIYINGNGPNPGNKTTIANNIATGNNFGIYLESTPNNTVTNNTVSYNKRGIHPVYADYNNLTNNTASHNDVGIAMILSYYNNITNNTASYNTVYYGIGLVGCDNNNLTNNTLNNNRMGINLLTSNNNRLTGNVIRDNTEYGFYVTGTSSGNVIWLNNISDSPNNALSHAGLNFWNSTVMMDYVYNGETFHNYTGNYWSEYSAPDTNLDGIGDVPYKIYGGSNPSGPLYYDNPDYYPMLLSGQAVPGPVSNIRTGLTYWSIQAAIDDTDTIAGDTILVNSSVYRERVNVYKVLNLTGVDTGSGLPVVDGYGGTSMSISVDGVTINGFNATNSSTGIYVGSSHNNITGNIVFNNSYDGIDVYNAYNNVTGNTVNNNTAEGIYLNAGAHDNNVAGNTANYNGYANIYLYNANYNDINGNTANFGKQNGLILQGSSAHNTIRANTLINNSQVGAYVYSMENNLTGNKANGNTWGFYVLGPDNNLTGNTANFNTQQGIMLSLCSGNNVTGNTANNNLQNGIYVDTSNANTFVGNTVDSNDRGFLLAGASGNTMTGNTALDNAGDGIYLSASSNNNVSDNAVTGNLNGIYLEGVNTGNYLGGNAVTGNTNNGIYLGDASNGNVTRNTVTGNGEGVYLRDSTGNVLWLNRIIDNTENASTNGGGTNHWNSTAQMPYDYAGGSFTNYTGNYWGDYEGPDNNVDGIGDVPRPISTDDPDYYPMLLTEPALPVVQLNLTAYSVNENDGSVTLRVNRSGYAAPAVAVDYTVAPGSAANGINYQAPSPNPDTLDIPAFTTYGEITIPILDDGLYGLPKTFTVTLSSPSGATLGANTSATVTIADQDPAPELYFASPTYEVNEGDGTVTITVTRINNADTNTAVEYNTTDSTAHEGVNYVNTSGLLKFNSGVMSQSFTVPILDDGVASGDLTFNVELTKVYSSPPHATIGSPSETVVTIHDNDAPIIPVADFEGDVTSGPAPLTVHFSSLSTGSPTLCEWDFGDGSSNISGFAATHTYFNAGSYTVTMTASNINGSDTMRKVNYITAAETSTVIPLTMGWNLVSYPFARGSQVNVEGLFAPVMGHVTIIWAYDPVDGWLYYIPGGSDNTLSTIDDTMGVWVLASSDTSLTVYGTLPASPPSIPLSAGWNLVGYPGLDSHTPADAFASIDGKYSVVWGFDDSTKAWLWYIPGGSDNNLVSIEPGCDYWVQMNEAGVLTPIV